MVVTDRCKSCVYYRSDASGHNLVPTCDYILVEGHRRGCPAGDSCTKYVQAFSSNGGRAHLPVPESEIFDLYYQGMSDAEISLKLNVSRHVIFNWRRRWSLPSTKEQERKARNEN